MALPAGTAMAQQIQPGTFKHIIIVVQENRTPDNLFGASSMVNSKCGQEQKPLIPGADIDNGGNGIPYGQTQPQPICNIPLSITGLYPCPSCHPVALADPDHSHGGWVTDYDLDSSGVSHMDGFCHEYDNSNWNGVCPSYSYVPQTEVQPYFDIASYYGFANYMFQTNEGPSFPAHQFLFAGTSAPAQYTGPSSEGTWFDADNVFHPTGEDSTCTAQGEIAPLIDSNGSEPNYIWCSTHHPQDPRCAAPCYERAPSPYTWGSLADLLGAQSPPVNWKYYAPPVNPNGAINGGLWVAPASIYHFCLPGWWYDKKNNKKYWECLGLLNNGQYASNMRWETTSNPVPIIDDITSCNLAQVSWVIPDGLWSDHAGENNGSGPSYVANIVNAIGESSQNSCGKDYWAGEPTAIFITWDDWGGWFDHINPSLTGGPGVNQTQGTWGAYYTYGFRVPALVVSAYTGTCTNPPTCTAWTGYVSGPCGLNTGYSCPNFGVSGNKQYVHDFGSILAFIEWNFLGLGGIGTIGQEGYPFADNYAPDWNPVTGQVPLLDFFTPSGPRPFQPINIPRRTR